MQRNSPAMLKVKLMSGCLFGILGVVLFVRMLMIQAPLQSKLLGFAFPLVAIALAAVRLREYARGRGTVP
jgi:hypothetical protein